MKIYHRLLDLSLLYHQASVILDTFDRAASPPVLLACLNNMFDCMADIDAMTPFVTSEIPLGVLRNIDRNRNPDLAAEQLLNEVLVASQHASDKISLLGDFESLLRASLSDTIDAAAQDGDIFASLAATTASTGEPAPSEPKAPTIDATSE
ncbi:hypothetical protein H696_04916 [Fonticula alba]|uniref:Mediator of RNA polymerase II transcription subunit 10 n=1 Tax=Fonticula alba TaxID=691883 RepID=A0A058Z2Z0_FONAL|nr:hypothetical protein H696_04916 [Fonticula alba]KCV68625.1 hypothetical protein H696_04916 [Fonticula alba]|eukprot:XP_009497057.1 hypothetical protein H696_04916 [Fonticula alba]